MTGLISISSAEWLDHLKSAIVNVISEVIALRPDLEANWLDSVSTYDSTKVWTDNIKLITRASIVNSVAHMHTAEHVTIADGWRAFSSGLKRRGSSNSVWYYQGGKLQIAPALGGTESIQIYYIDFPLNDQDGTALSATSTNIDRVSPDLEEGILEYVCIRIFQELTGNEAGRHDTNDISNLGSSFPASVNTPIISDLTFNQIPLNTISNIDMRSIPTSISLSNFASYSGNPGALNITSVAPTVPSVAMSMINFNELQPTYTAPTTGLSLTAFGSHTDHLASSNITTSPPTVPNVPAFTVPSGALSNVVGSYTTGWNTAVPTYTPPTDIVLTPFSFADVIGDSDPGVFSSSTAAPSAITDTITTFATYLGTPTAGGTVTGGTSGDYYKAMERVKALLGAGIDTDANSTVDADEPQGVEYWLNDEDTEMLAATLQAAQAELSKANGYIDGALRAFQTDIDAYQADVGRYSAETQAYSAEINAEIQAYRMKLDRYSAELQASVQAWESREAKKLQQYNALQEDAKNQFNAEMAQYERELQNKTEEMRTQAQADISKMQTSTDASYQADAVKLDKEMKEYTATLDRFRSDTALWQQNVNFQISEYTQNLNRALQSWQAEYDQEFRKYTAEQQDSLQSYTAALNIYTQKFQEALEQSKLDESNDMKLLQKYSNELQQYQLDINKEVQQHATNLESALSSWQKEQELDIQRYQSELTQANAVFQSDMQVNIKDQDTKTQIDITNASKALEADLQTITTKLNRYQADLQKYTAESNLGISKWQTQINKITSAQQSYMAQLNIHRQNYADFLRRIAGNPANPVGSEEAASKNA